MHFLAIRKRARTRQDGQEWAQATVINKTRKFGAVLSEKTISVKKPILITGAHASGKSRWLNRLHKEAPRIWATRAKAVPLHLAASNALAEWTDGKHLELWWAGRNDPDETRHWSKLKPHEKYRALPLYLQETKAVLFVDDAHTLTTNSKKGKIVQECVRAAEIWVMAAADEGRLFPGLRQDVIHSSPQIFRLDSDVAYDATPMFMWLLIAMAMAMGSWELAMALGGLKMLGSGRRATKQN